MFLSMFFLVNTPAFTESKISYYWWGDVFFYLSIFLFLVFEAENIKNWIKIMKLLWRDILRALNDA
jgi:hypothetical protein